MNRRIRRHGEIAVKSLELQVRRFGPLVQDAGRGKFPNRRLATGRRLSLNRLEVAVDDCSVLGVEGVPKCSIERRALQRTRCVVCRSYEWHFASRPTPQRDVR